MRFLLKISLLFIISINAYTNDNILVFNQNSENYPQINFNAYNFINNQSNPIEIINLDVYENSLKINDFNININKLNDTISNKNLFVFAIDLSSSVSSGIIQSYKTFISNFLSKVNFSDNRFAIIGFNNFAFSITSPDTNTQLVNNIFSNLRYFGNTNYDSLFQGEFNALSYQNYSDEKYQVIILNDGSGIMNESAVEQIVSKKNANIYSVSFKSANIQSLKDLISSRNCLFFDNVNNLEQVDYYSDLIYLHSLGYRPYQISYISNSCSELNEIDIINSENNINSKFSLGIDNSKFPFIKFIETNSIDFGLVEKSTSKIVKLKIKPINSDILLERIIDDNIFKISGINQNQILKKDNIYEISVKYLPIDTNYIFRKLELIHNSCYQSEILVSGGVANKENLPQNLKLLSPNGSEKINVFDNYVIKWEGILSDDTISIDFSPDNGANWDLVTPKASGLSYNWINPPNLITNLGLIRIKNLSKKDEYQQIKSLKGINGNIVGLKWSSRPNQLYTGSKDGFIRLWDTKKIEPLKTILNGINNLNFFDLSYDEKFISVVDNNKKLISIYDIQTSFLLNEYHLEQDIVYLDWDDVSNNFVIGTLDGSVSIYEYPNQDPVFQTKLQNMSISVIRFSPLGNKIAIGTNEGQIIIYNINGQLINQFKNSDVPITDLSWNKSNTIISVSTTIDIVKIWDTESGTNVLQINDKAKPVYKTSWSSNLKFISTINANNTINLWKPEDGTLFYSFNLHSNIVSDLVWNQDGTTIASGANEGEVLIWSVNDIPFERLLLQEDQSDAVFSLVKPSLLKNDVFLGQHSIGISFDSTVSKFITNNGLIDITLDSIKVWGDTKDNFDIINKFPIQLNVGDSFDLKINFTPQKEHVFVDSIVIFSKNINYKSLLNAIGTTKKINIEPKLINFGAQKIGTISNSKEFTIENLSSETIEIDDYILDIKNGIIINNFSADALKPFEKRVFNVTFEPKQIGEISSINYLKFSDINDFEYFVFNGKGIAPIVNIPSNIELPNILCENQKTSKSINIKNFGNDTLLIDSIYIQQANLDFTLDNSGLKYSILPSDSTSIIVNFEKKNQGFSTANLIIKTNKNVNLKDEFKISLIGQKENIVIELLDNEVNLFADINESKNTKTRIYNKGTIPIIINPQFDNNNFTIISNLPLILIPNDSIDLEIKLMPKSENGLFTSILILKDTCDKIYSIKFNAYIGLKNAKISVVNSLIFDTLICRNVSNTKSILIKNIGEVPLIINDIMFENSGQDNFSISKSLNKKILQKNEIDSIQLFVDAVEIGPISSELRIFSNAENTIDGYNTVKLSSYISFSSAKPAVDTVFLNDLFENKIYHQGLKVKNNGNTNLVWNVPILYDFFIIDSIVPNITIPKQESTIYFTFKGGLSTNSYFQDFKFGNTCDTEQKLVLVANVNKKAALGIKAGIINSAPGDTIELPIYLYLKESNSFPIVERYECDLEFNGTLLIPIDYESSLDENFKRTVSVKLNSEPDDQGIIGKIRFISYLGNSDSTIIAISNSKAVGGEGFTIEENNGLFYLDSVCYSGGARLIGSSGILRLFPNFPNPVLSNTTIPFSIIEKGNYKLEIFDLLSNIVSKIDLSEMLPGAYEITIDLSNYAAGNYFYLLRTPSTILIRKMTINR